MPEHKNVIEAIRAVMNDLPAIPKDQESAQLRYKFRGIEQIVELAKPLFVEHGLVVLPEVLTWEESELTINNNRWTDQRLLIRWTFYGPGGTDDKVSATVAGIGRDNSDKGANKAIVQAFKYTLITALMIADSSDDSDKEEPHTAEAAARRARDAQRDAHTKKPPFDKAKAVDRIRQFAETLDALKPRPGTDTWLVAIEDAVMQQAGVKLDELNETNLEIVGKHIRDIVEGRREVDDLTFGAS